MLVPRRVSHYDPHPHANNDEDFEKLDEIYENVESVNERLKSAAWTPWIASQQRVFLYVRQAMGGECSKKYQQKWVFRRKRVQQQHIGGFMKSKLIWESLWPSICHILKVCHLPATKKSVEIIG